MYIYTGIGDRVQVSFGASARTIAATGGANALLVQALTQNVRISLGSTPAGASEGIQIKAGDPARLIPVGAGGAITCQQETSGAAFYAQPVRVDWVEP